MTGSRLSGLSREEINYMKKKFIIPVILVCTALVISTAALAALKYNLVSKFKSSFGVVKSNNKVPYSVQGHEENKTATDKKETKKIKINDGYVSADINLSFIKDKNNKSILIEDRDEPYHFVLIPNSDQYIIEYDKNLYKLDLEKNSITPLLKDDVPGFNKKDLIKMSKEKKIDNLVLSWGENPSVNLTGTKLTFISNRNGVKNEDGGNSVWLKDLTTNEEKMLGEIGYTCLGWDKSDNVYYFDLNQNVVRINTNNGDKSTISEKVNPESVFLYPYLILVGEKQIDFLNVETNEKKSFSDSTINDCVYFKHNNKNLVAFQAREKSNEDPVLIVILNTDDLSCKVIQPLDDTFFEDYSWLDAETLIVTSTTSGSMEQRTYFINVNELD